MEIESEKIDDVLKVKPLEKRIDASISADFRGRMREWISEGNRRIVLDLSAVEFVDSSGLGAVASSLKAVKDRDGLVISGIRGAVEDLFHLTRMDRVFRIFESAADAVDFFRKNRGEKGGT